ncbi:MAG: N-acetylated-alpha-linked acidic dipeptidase, partial [Acidobacteriaceae bacterium]|nr:N-acetylated-alpha-linked acidic dipeptidase [Acidobacteriaceae bacterium]
MKKPSSLFVKRFSAVALLSLAVFLFWSDLAQRAFSAAPTTKISGFSPQHAAEETSLEDQLKKLISTEEIRKQHRYFTSIPHPAGSIHDREVAEYIAEQWKNQGLEDVVIRRYDVLGTRPLSTSLEMVAPSRYQALLREAPYDVDPDTKNPEVANAWLGYSASGEITAPVVYADSGNPEDYDLLRKNGIDVKGKIVLVRYSNPYSYRGFKALTAEKNGAAALLIYSDPAEDGYVKGKVFPDGPWGPETHIQRGAITYDFIVPGDPLTPGWASVSGAKRISQTEARSLPHIVALPLSWHDAKPLLENMNGPTAPKNWQGGLPITYRLTGAVQAHLKVEMDNSIQPYYVVEARIRGAQFPDEWVLLGNHHDAWEYGGVDPSSGTASMMELTRAFGTMLRNGFRPKRTLIFCSWDGEEIGLTGSTEWGEQFADDLRKKLIAYINVDSSASGPNFEGGAVGSLAPMLVETSYTIADPSGANLHEAWIKSTAAARKNDKHTQRPKDENLVNTRIGSGSDHTVFLNFLGRPVITLAFDGPYGVYHSVYDNFYWMNQFGDPGYKYHATMSALWGVTALRLSQADILPFDFGFYGHTLNNFLDDLKTNPRYDASKLHLNDLQKRASNFEAAGKSVKTLLDRAVASGKIETQPAEQFNQSILKVESNWLNPDGIPGRPWFKHLLYCARYTYAHLELPGLTEAVESQNWEEAQHQS